MASNLSSIGFAFTDAEEFQQAMLAIAPETVERVGCEVGDYAIWRSRTGAEIWFHLPMLGTEDDARDIAGLTPFYEGLGAVQIEVVERRKRPGDTDFEGLLSGNVGTADDAYPIVFEAIDFAAHVQQPLPFKAQARIVAFARSLRAFADEKAYAADKEGPLGEIGLAPRAFISLAAFSEDTGEQEQAETPDTSALLTGQVIEHRLQLNERTGNAFHWLLVESLDATFDVVADPDIVEGDIIVGGTVEVAGVLIGRLIERAP